MRGQSPRSLIFPLCFEKLGNEGTVPSFPLDQADGVEAETRLTEVFIDFASLP